MNTTETDVSEEVEEEELLVYADFDTVIDESMFQKDSLFKIIGLNADEPFLQIGSQMYSGKWYDTVGTNLFLEPEPAPPPSDPVFSDVSPTLLNYKFKTRKCLELSRVFINPKHKEESGNLSLPRGSDVAGKPNTSSDCLPEDTVDVAGKPNTSSDHLPEDTVDVAGKPNTSSDHLPEDTVDVAGKPNTSSDHLPEDTMEISEKKVNIQKL